MVGGEKSLVIGDTEVTLLVRIFCTIFIDDLADSAPDYTLRMFFLAIFGNNTALMPIGPKRTYQLLNGCP